MRKCDRCDKELPETEDEIDDVVRICLGGTQQTYDLCFDCAKAVEDFITKEE